MAAFENLSDTDIQILGDKLEALDESFSWGRGLADDREWVLHYLKEYMMQRGINTVADAIVRIDQEILAKLFSPFHI